MGVFQGVLVPWDVGLKNDGLAHVDVLEPDDECSRLTRLNLIVFLLNDNIRILIVIELGEVKIDAMLFQKRNIVHDELGFVGVVGHA